MNISALFLITFLGGGSLFGWQVVNDAGTYDKAVEKASAQQQELEIDCVVVFGAAVWPSGNPSAALRDRMFTAIDWVKRHNNHCLILSGGGYQDPRPHEVTVMRKMALRAGLPENILTLDRQGVNTLASIMNLDPTRKYLLVSNDFHLARIRMLAWKNKIQALTMPAEYHSRRYIKENSFRLRELVAFAYYLFAPLPKRDPLPQPQEKPKALR